MAQYRRKVEVVEAVRWTGQNVQEVNEFFGMDLVDPDDEDYKLAANQRFVIEADEGEVTVECGDYLIREGNGFRRLRPHEFESTYEPEAQQQPASGG